MRINRVTQSIVVGAVTLISAFTWIGLKNFLYGDGLWQWPLLGFLAIAVFLSFSWILTEVKRVLAVALFFMLITFFFAFGWRWQYLLVLAIAFLIMAFASYQAVNEKQARIKIQPSKIIKRGLPLTITALALIITMAYYFSPLAIQGKSEIKIPRPLFEKAIGPFIESLEGQFAEEALNMGFYKSADANESGIMKKGGEIKEDLYQAVNQRINRFSQSYSDFLSLGVALGVFFALKAIGVLFIWLTIFVSLAIFKILKIIGAIEIKEESVAKEVIKI